jgi:hypothetical protein
MQEFSIFPGMIFHPLNVSRKEIQKLPTLSLCHIIVSRMFGKDLGRQGIARGTIMAT